jgi:alkaline phosphatase D
MLSLNELDRVINRENGISRRLWLGYCSALAAIPMLGSRAEGRVVSQPKFESDPFTLGVASGEPTSTGVVLWTRLAPKPLEPFGGMNTDLIEVSWVIAEDEALTKVVAQGISLATPQLGHSVHVEVDGLQPGRFYHYKFRSGDAESPVGRTRTMPASDTLPEKLKFAFASCQHFETGYYTAYEDMLQQAPDLVFHLGDYIYEGKGRDGLVRKHVGNEIKTLEDYRIRHALYRSDTALKAMHGACPWLVTWDDHEVDNNYAGNISEEKGVSPAELLTRRANAYQAYYEAMPLRRSSLPAGPDMKLYRTAKFGRLAEFAVLDTRQYRSDQPNGDKASPLNEAARDEKASMLGSKQRGWLMSNLLRSESLWNVLAQQVMMGVNTVSRDETEKFSMDQWPGYLAERDALLGFMKTRRISNPVVLTGDIHSNWVNDLRPESREFETTIVATEFVGTSISSGGDGTAEPPYLQLLHSRNPGVKYFNAQRGYVLCTVTPEKWQSDYRIVEKVTTPGASVETKASFVVEEGKPGAVKA